MGGEDIHICQICQSEFETEEDLSLHACVEIKEELQDPKILVGYDICHDYGLDLSEEFLSGILKLVNELCDVVRNGDPDLKRTSEVNKNLNTAVSCYRSRLLLIDSKHIEMQDNWDNYDNLPQESKMESDKSDSDTDYKPKIGNKVKKKCVRRVAKPRFSRPQKPGIPSYLKAKTIDIDDIVLFQYLKFNMQQKKFECRICEKATALRHNAFIHLKLRHENDLTLKPTQFEPKVDCGDRSCKKLYGLTKRRLWCRQCTSISRIPKKYYYYTKIGDRENHEAKFELCPECGKNVQHLKAHIRVIHNMVEQTCSQCGLKCKSVKYLKQHVQTMHEKVPCVECGKLYGVAVMKRHIQAQHTPNDERRFKCELCGKGFATNQRLKDHNNVHTGEKPYKCKFCYACFASRGTHAMHQRSHLGHRRSK